MALFKNPFSRQPNDAASYADFWRWFAANAQAFYTIVEHHDSNAISKQVFDPMAKQLEAIYPGITFLVGIDQENDADLIFSAEGDVKAFVFIEELVAAAPPLPNWKFTALKPATNQDRFTITIDQYTFDSQQLSCYIDHDPAFPAEAHLVITYPYFNERDKDTIQTGAWLYIENHIGELAASTLIDSMTITTPANKPDTNPVPIEQLTQQLLANRHTYDSTDLEPDADNQEAHEYVLLQALSNNECAILATLNTSLKDWPHKPAYPWMLQLTNKYVSKNDDSGLPAVNTLEQMADLEESLIIHLKGAVSALHLGQVTGEGKRTVYIALRDFRTPSKLVHQWIRQQKRATNLTYHIALDKYWSSVPFLNQL